MPRVLRPIPWHSEGHKACFFKDKLQIDTINQDEKQFEAINIKQRICMLGLRIALAEHK